MGAEWRSEVDWSGLEWTGRERIARSLVKWSMNIHWLCAPECAKIAHRGASKLQLLEIVPCNCLRAAHACSAHNLPLPSKSFVIVMCTNTEREREREREGMIDRMPGIIHHMLQQKRVANTDRHLFT